MQRKLLGVCGFLLFGLFAASSGAFAVPEQSELEPAATQIYQCTMNWSADSTECKARKTNGPCTTKYQGDHSSEAEANGVSTSVASG
jgi:hypothetical protein